LEQWIHSGGKRRNGIGQVRKYPFRRQYRLRRRRC
jgi:hypothetical protein